MYTYEISTYMLFQEHQTYVKNLNTYNESGHSKCIGSGASRSVDIMGILKQKLRLNGIYKSAAKKGIVPSLLIEVTKVYIETTVLHIVTRVIGTIQPTDRLEIQRIVLLHIICGGASRSS